MPTTEEVGLRLKEVRKAAQMTLKEVAQASGMSPTHISEIERGKTSPTVGALRKIAAALGKDTAYFVEDAALPRVSVVKKEDREVVLLKGESEVFIKGKALTAGIPAGRVELVLVEESDGGSVSYTPHDGEEALVMLSGTAHAVVDGREYVVESGDCLHYSGKLEHAITFVGDGKNKALFVKVRPGAIRW